MFEGQGKAVLYTGDTRSEPWLVDSLARNPALIEYAAGPGTASGLRTLDRIYLDTTFARQDAAFPTKAEGLAELLRKVASYPPDTVFHFQAWTYGYEEVWMALAKALNTQVRSMQDPPSLHLRFQAQGVIRVDSKREREGCRST